MTLHICAPEPDLVLIQWNPCSTCTGSPGTTRGVARRSPMVLAHYPWYGADWTCLRCGERWTDGERCERPFAPAWRKKNIEAAKKLWRAFNG